MYAARFQSATKETEWFDILASTLEGLGQLYLMIDVDLLEKSGSIGERWIAEFPRFFKKLLERSIKTVVKVAFICPTGRKWQAAEVVDSVIDLGSPRRGKSRGRRPGVLSNPRRGRGDRRKRVYRDIGNI
jgi:hypothetical protein